MNLKHLFELQAKLDERIYKEHPQKEGEDRLAKKILALLVGLSELANCWRGFKYWSNDQEPITKVIDFALWVKNGRAVDEEGKPTNCFKNPLLEEYVDCLHFILSIGLELNFTNIDVWKVKETTTTNQFIESFGTIYSIHFQKRVNGEVPRIMYEHLFAYFIGLGEMLGFTWEQVEEAYIEKNKVNHERQESGY